MKIRDDSSARGARVDFALERFDEFGERPGAEVALGAMADGDGAGFGFLGTDHEHVGNLLQLCVADFGGGLFFAGAEMDPKIFALPIFRSPLSHTPPSLP